MSKPAERPDCGVIDADGHVLEPWEAWRDLPARIRPRSEVDDQGLDHVIIGDRRFTSLKSLGLWPK